MRLWIERPYRLFKNNFASWSASYEAVNWKDYDIPESTRAAKVSLIWDCELKGYQIIRLWKGWSVSLIWGCELKDEDAVEYLGTTEGSASYEAVNWKTPPQSTTASHLWSASYEAVNWKAV